MDSLLSGGETIPFRMTLQIKGTESLFIQPVGHVTDVEMTSNCTTPSFMGDFLPSDRNVTDTGFTARVVVKAMETLNPQVHTQDDFEHKLWDHLFMIAGYDLDIDAPFPKPLPEERDVPAEIS